jgi:hypothetical protein
MKHHLENFLLVDKKDQQTTPTRRKRRRITPEKPFFFNNLPLEIQQMILNALVFQSQELRATTWQNIPQVNKTWNNWYTHQVKMGCNIDNNATLLHQIHAKILATEYAQIGFQNEQEGKIHQMAISNNKFNITNPKRNWERGTLLQDKIEYIQNERWCTPIEDYLVTNILGWSFTCDQQEQQQRRMQKPRQPKIEDYLINPKHHHQFAKKEDEEETTTTTTPSPSNNWNTSIVQITQALMETDAQKLQTLWETIFKTTPCSNPTHFKKLCTCCKELIVTS